MTTEEKALAEVRKWSAEIDAKLSAGECPKCGGRIERLGADGRQVGATLLPGEWVRYRCACGYGIDSVESGPRASA